MINKFIKVLETHWLLVLQFFVIPSRLNFSRGGLNVDFVFSSEKQICKCIKVWQLFVYFMTFACKFCWLSTIIFLCLGYRILELHLTPLVIFELLSHRYVVLLTISVLEILLRHNLRFVCYPTGSPVLSKHSQRYIFLTFSVSWIQTCLKFKKTLLGNIFHLLPVLYP